ncbi:MAG TPA: insulinase family protein [Anaerolineae bacterium]|nr:insulinase family protein [Anaerolineae bacterium]HQK13202.1 insulinase family protein [Anaerolineae bacterium]
MSYGFELLETRTIPELNTRARLYRHVETGAQLLSLENDDENKVFAVALRTPPPDSTGLPHIMEHAVLCGSRKYPVKEPFIELAKGSLHTFLNAFTFNDKTVYPIASQNVQDFYNLIDVYLDAVFYPRLMPETMQQEGWHYELEHPDAPLTYKGVVFNEMKGAYSSPDTLVARYSEQSLFENHVYALDSGGDPEVIPQLTYAQFKAFHETYYHPSNARFFFYGDDDPEKRLQLIQAYLKDYTARHVESRIPLQTRYDAPRRLSRPYPVSADTPAPKAYITVNWLLPENTDPALTLALEILGHILVGIPASPLRKALIDSGLGEDIIGNGLDDGLRQLTFSTGLKGVRREDTPKVEALIFDTLRNLATNGIDPDTIAASLNTVEFNLREQNFGSFPRGLVLFIRALSTWLHDGDPFAPIAFETPLNAVKAALAANPHYFEDLIQAHLLDNPHHTVFVLEPDATLAQHQEAAERERLAQARATMTAEELRALVENTARLKALQEAPDSPEALATIPRLTLADLDKQSRHVPTETGDLEDVRVLYHDLFTNGIVYVDVGFDLHTLPQDLLPYATLFGAALLEIGTQTEDFVKLTQRIGQKTGGIAPATFHGLVRDTDRATNWLFLRGKATVAQTDDLLAILRDVLLTVQLDNRERFMQMLLEKKAREETMLIPAGHRVALSRLRARFNEAYWAAEQIEGLNYLFFLRRLTGQVQQDWPAVLAKLEEVRDILVNRKAMLCNVTVDGESWRTVQPKLSNFLASLPAREVTRAVWTPETLTGPEGLTIPAQVNYVGKGGSLFDLGYTRHGSLEVITNYLRTSYLWEKIRIQGGAYGALCFADPHTGVLSYVSYRDPNLLATLKHYDRVSVFLRHLELSEDELVKSIIGAIGTLDAYQLPDAKGYSALGRYLIGYSDAARQQYRDEVLSTTVADFRAFADVLDRLNTTGEIVVLGSPDAIAAAQAEWGVDFTITKVL